MDTKYNHTPKSKKKIKYQNVCAICASTKRLITIKRAGGDIHLCPRHARAAGGI